MALIFFDRTTDIGTQLWATDGTSAGTHLVRQIDTGNPSRFTHVNGNVFFTASDFENDTGNELWVTDGTEAGTRLVKDIRPGIETALPRDLVNVNGTLFFVANDGTNGPELWKSDGTEDGTVMVEDIVADPDSFSQGLRSLTNVNGTLFFTVDDGDGERLWKSDGTETGTVLVKDFPASEVSGDVYGLTAVGSTLFFATIGGMGDFNNDGYELWKSDGTDAGTVMVADISPGVNGSSDPLSLTDINGTLYFQATDGPPVGFPAGSGVELWRSNGSEPGTLMVRDINPDTRPLYGDSRPYGFTDVNGIVFFAADDGVNGVELWKSDGTFAGTVLVKDIYPGPGKTNFIEGEGDSILQNEFVNVDGVLFFVANDGVHGYELWKSDGSEHGTVLVKDVRPGAEPTFNFLAHDLTSVDGLLYFVADDGSGEAVWKSDGTEAGTAPVSDATPIGTRLLAIGTNTANSDFTHDHTDDVAFQHAGTGQAIFAAMSAGVFAGWGAATGGLGTLAVAGKGDVNNDGFADIFVRDPANGSIFVARQHGANSADWSIVTVALTSDWALAAVADVNGDEFADAIVQDQTTGTIFFADMLHGAFHGWGVVSTTLTSDWKAVGAGDINRDGFADVVVQHESTGNTLWANMANGVFSGWGVVTTSVTSDWKVKAIADTSGDGFADVVFQEQATGSALYADMKNGAFHHWGVVAQNTGPGWIAKAAADVNNDGNFDVVLQNAADGTAYYAAMDDNGFAGWGIVAANIGTDWHVA